jgi:hypothetical protein
MPIGLLSVLTFVESGANGGLVFDFLLFFVREGSTLAVTPQRVEDF